jgi:hypothetical protein
LKVHVRDPVGPADACRPSASSWRFPEISHTWLMPPGELMVFAVVDEFSPMQPTSMAPGTVVVTPGSTPLRAIAPPLVVAGTSRGAVGDTPA